MKDPLYRAIEEHWREHRPRMVQRLEAKGLLEPAIEEAAHRTTSAEASLMQQGVSCPDAQEMMRQEWAFLPAETDQPELPNGPPERWLDGPTSPVNQPRRSGADAPALSSLFASVNQKSLI